MKIVTLDNTTAVRLRYLRKMNRFVKENAQEVQKELKGEFVRRSPRKPAKGQGRPLYLYDATGRKVKPMTEFVRELKSEVRRGTALSGRAISSRRQKKAGGRTNAAWINSALKTHDDTPVKTPSMPGQPPITWRNVNKGGSGHPQAGYPDYFMRSRVRMVKNSAASYEVFIKQWKTSEAVFKVLEKGGSIHKSKKRLLGYTRVPYQVGSRKRYRIDPKFEKTGSVPNLRARPFLAPVEKKVKKSTIDFFKREP